MLFDKIALVVFLAVFVSVGSLSPVYADVTVERFFKSGGIGGVGASESKQKEYIRGIKKREDSTMKFTGAVLGRLAGEQSTSAVYRIDKDIIWDLDHPKKSYTERPIFMPAGKVSSTAEKDNNKARREGKKEEEVRIIKNEFRVEATGKKKTINNFPCEQYILTWLVEMENVKTKERSTNQMTTELWNTTEDARIRTLEKEESEFNQAYMKKLGIEMTQQDIQKFGLGMLGSSMGDAADRLKKELSKIEGYPIVTSVRWEARADEKSGAQQKPEARKKQEKEKEGDEDTDISEGLGGILGGFMKKKMTEKQKEKNAGEDEKGTKPLFESYFEIKGIDTSTLADSLFDVPAGYKKIGQ